MIVYVAGMPFNLHAHITHAYIRWEKALFKVFFNEQYFIKALLNTNVQTQNKHIKLFNP